MGGIYPWFAEEVQYASTIHEAIMRDWSARKEEREEVFARAVRQLFGFPTSFSNEQIIAAYENAAAYYHDQVYEMTTWFASAFVRLGTESRIANTTNPVDLLINALENGSDGPIDVRRKFEALRKWVHASRLVRQRRQENETAVRAEMGHIMRTVESRLFVPNQSVEPQTWAVMKEEESSGNFVFDRMFEHGSDSVLDHTVLDLTMPMRLVEIGADRLIEVVVFDRVKTDWSTYMKMIEEKFDDPRKLKDRRGFTFLVSAREEKKALERVLLERVLVSEFKVDENYIKKSQRGFYARRFRVRWHDRPVEIHIMLLKDFVNCEQSSHSAHHDRHRLERMLKYIFPLHFPVWVYGVDWDDDVVCSVFERILNDNLRNKVLCRAKALAAMQRR
ncbi:TPA: hypothetical protein DCZ32_02720 [Candidatus Uhrbacteria bacterium]|nr:hypothetical protein [Candidatus Uhrbacteria bacterium]